MTVDRAVFESTATIDAWDGDYYHPAALRFYDQSIAAMFEAMGAAPGDTVLDAGCGPGEHSIRAARLGLRVHAIDISEAMLAEARRRVQAAGLGAQVRFERQDLTRLTLPSNAFQRVFSWGVVIHIEEVDRALDELCRVVAPGGALALAVSNRASFDYALERSARFLLRRPLAGLERREAGDGVAYEFQGERLWLWRFRRDWLIRSLARRGFTLRRELMGSLTEAHIRLTGPLKTALLRLNDLAARVGAPRSLAAMNVSVFVKRPGPAAS